jgi:ferredoxin-thioredoxin reductase catalytic subunit/rubredoxin
MAFMSASGDRARELMARLRQEAEEGGYHLNPDEEMVMMLCEGLLANLDRYGYMGCPCRLLEGDKARDLDLICPCDYRDADLAEFGVCYCALYVSEEVLAGRVEVHSIPERRPSDQERAQAVKPRRPLPSGPAVWRCRVCGYLCARDQPPERCPVCKAHQDRFETFISRPTAQPQVWRCKVCGYLAARDRPAERCPVCKAGKDRFEPFAF